MREYSSVLSRKQYLVLAEVIFYLLKNSRIVLDVKVCSGRGNGRQVALSF